MNYLHVLTVRWASRQTRDSMTDLERVIVEYFHKATTDADRLQAEGAAMELKELNAVSEGRRQMLDKKAEELRAEWIRAEQAEAKAAALEGSGRQ